MKKKGKDFLLRYRSLVFVCAGAFFLFALLLFFHRNRIGEEAALNQTAKGTKELIIIDPGHGGMQGRPKKSVRLGRYVYTIQIKCSCAFPPVCTLYEQTGGLC